MSGKKNVVFVSPWPPQLTGIGEYAFNLISRLNQLAIFNITVVTSCLNPVLVTGITIISCSNEQNLPVLDDVDLIIHQVGNHYVHVLNYLILKKYGGIIQFHEIVIHDLVKHIACTTGNAENYSRILEQWYGLAAVNLEKNLQSEGKQLYASPAVIDSPFFEEFAQYADAIIVHSQLSKRKVLQSFPDKEVLTTSVMHLLAEPTVKKELNGGITIGSFGIAHLFRHNDKVIKAFYLLLKYCAQHSLALPKLVFVGACDFNDEKKQVDELNIAHQVEFVISPPLDQYNTLLSQMDLIIQLRYPSRGESSGAITKALQLGIPTMVTAIGWYSELPEFVEKTVAPPDDDNIYAMIKKILYPSATELSYSDRLTISKTYADSLSYEQYVQDYGQRIEQLMARHTQCKKTTKGMSANPLLKNSLKSDSQRPHVLVDISLGLDGYSGIPQDARLLFKTLNEIEQIKVSGLIYTHSKGSLRHNVEKFHKMNTTDQSVATAAFLSQIINPEHTVYHQVKYFRYLQKLNEYRKLLQKKSFGVSLINNDVFYDVIWRNIFSKTLTPALCDVFRDNDFYVSNINHVSMNYHASRTRPVKLDTSAFDIVVFQDQRPLTVSPNTTKIVRYHDAIPITDLDTSHALGVMSHGNALRVCGNDSFYVCNSEPTRESLLMLNPQLEKKSITIPYALPDFYYKKQNYLRLQQIFESRSVQGKFKGNVGFDYILSVGTVEPRKNHLSLIKAFQQLRVRTSKPIKLVMVGNPGWKNEKILKEMNYLIHEGSLIHLEGLTYEELQYAYSHALSFVFPSFNEGFGFPPLEAMMCGCPVIVSDIKAHQWVMGDAVMYCNPNDIDSICHAMEQMTLLPESNTIRQAYIQKGLQRVKLYSFENVRVQWQELFDTLTAEKRAHG